MKILSLALACVVGCGVSNQKSDLPANPAPKEQGGQSLKSPPKEKGAPEAQIIRQQVVTGPDGRHYTINVPAVPAGKPLPTLPPKKTESEPIRLPRDAN